MMACETDRDGRRTSATTVEGLTFAIYYCTTDIFPDVRLPGSILSMMYSKRLLKSLRYVFTNFRKDIANLLVLGVI